MFKVEKQTVIMAASREIARIIKRRSYVRDLEINRLIKSRMYFWIRTREKAEEIAIPFWENLEYKTLQRAESYLSACSIMIGDYVGLTLEEANQISNWVKKAANS